MKTLIVNKTFNQRYLYRWAAHLIQPENDNAYINETHVHWNSNYYGAQYGIRQYIFAFTDMASHSGSLNRTLNNYDGYGVFTPISTLSVVSQTFLGLIDRLNLAILNGEIGNTTLGNIDTDNPSSIKEELNLNYLFNTLYGKNLIARNNALQWCVDKGFCTEEEMIRIIATCSPTDEYSVGNVSIDLIDDLTTYELTSSKPVSLSVQYRQENNMIDEPMYLMILPLVTEKFSDTGDSVALGVYNHDSSHYDTLYEQDYSRYGIVYYTRYYKSLTSFYSVEKSRSLPQSPYMAFSIGVQGSGSDIEFDYTDKIDYIDDFKIRFTIPKKIM